MLDSLISDNSNLLNSREKPCLNGLSGGMETLGEIHQTPMKSFITGGISPQLLEIPQVVGSDNFFLSNGEVLSDSALVEQALETAKDILTGLATDPDFTNKMNIAFGNNWDANIFSNLVTDWLTGDFSELPKIEIRAGVEINGANGAFAAANDTIYLSSDFLSRNGSDAGAVTKVLLEEIGHSIDSKINISDAPGDEGEIFAKVVQGQTISATELLGLKAEDDTAIISIDGKDISIEMSQIALASLNGRLYQSHQGFDNKIYTRSSTDGVSWTGWNSNGGGETPSAIALEALNGRLYQSVRGTDDKIYTRSSTDGVNWTGWNSNGGGTTKSSPALAVLNNTLYQSHRGLDNKIYTRSSTNGVNWTGWNSNGGGTTISTPSLEALNGRLYQSVRGTDNQIYTRSSTDGVNWTGWNSNGGGTTPSAPSLEALNGRLYQSVRGTDNQIYTRSSTDGVNWTGWNSNGGGTTPSAPSLEALNGRLYQSVQGQDDKIYTRSSTDGLNWTGWNSNGGGTTPTELPELTDAKWDEYSGDNTRFDPNPAGDGNVDERSKTPKSIAQLYTDLSTAIFGQRRLMNAGYLYDQSYYDKVVIQGTTGWWHSGIDFSAQAGNIVKAAADGKVVWRDDTSASSNGYFIAVEDKNGKQWVYGHLQSLGTWKEGDPVKVGAQIGTVGSQLGSNAHFHLAVGTKNGSVRSSKDQNKVRQATMSPLQAYWLWKNT